jgi:hypothetical protein
LNEEVKVIRKKGFFQGQTKSWKLVLVIKVNVRKRAGRLLGREEEEGDTNCTCYDEAT